MEYCHLWRVCSNPVLMYLSLKGLFLSGFGRRHLAGFFNPKKGSPLCLSCDVQGDFYQVDVCALDIITV